VKNKKFFKDARARLHTRGIHLQDAAEALYHECYPNDVLFATEGWAALCPAM